MKIINGQVWEPETISLICRFASTGDVIHAGAYFGDFLPAISRTLSSSAKLWAFEPSSENFQSAGITCRLNDLRNVELHHCGLGERSERRALKIGESGTSFGGGSHILGLGKDTTPSEEIESIAVVPIDSVLPPYRSVSVLQLDVEGHELAALAGGLDTICRWQPLIILETLPKDWVQTNLAPLGYRVVGRCHYNSILAVSNVII